MSATLDLPRRRLRRADCAARASGGAGAAAASPSGRRGERIEDEETLERIRELAIPPAWQEVWICPDPLGHIQATGIDAAGRKQYLYHERWQQRQAERKFEAVREFAARSCRGCAARSPPTSARQGMPRERALACAVRLLDLGFFRVGGEDYAEENESYGLATIRREHVAIERRRGGLRLPGQERPAPGPVDPRPGGVARRVEAMRRRRSGPEDLLAYREGGGWRDVRSDDINDYIQETIGERLLGQGLPHLARHRAGRRRARRRAEAAIGSGGASGRSRAAVERVAEALGNTPAVCRRSYIDPRVFDRYRDGETIEPAGSRNGRLTAKRRLRIEREVIELVS